MTLSARLQSLIDAGVHRIGELEIRLETAGHSFLLCHHLDAEAAGREGFGGLEIHHGPDDARDLSTWSEDGGYRFAKAQTNLRRGWVMLLADIDQLRLALDGFYPAAVGVFAAMLDGTLDVQNLREKLERQTGMYRFARTISDEGAQRLVGEVCGPAHQCARRILWRLDDNTPLDDSDASRYNGVPGEIPENEAIPLLCREACNHMVAECRRVAKEEAGK